MPCVLGPRYWGSLAGSLVTHLIFQLVKVLLVSIGAADVVGVVGQGKHAGVGMIGWHSRSFGNRVPWVAAMVVQPACRSRTCWLAAGDCTRAMKFHQSWRQGPAAFLGWRWEEGAQDVH